MKKLSFADALHPESRLVMTTTTTTEEGDDDGTDDGQPSWERFWQEARGDMPIAIAERVDDRRENHGIDDNAAAAAAVTGATEEEEANENINSDTNNNDHQVESGEVANGRFNDNERRSVKFEGCFYLEGLVGGLFALCAVVGVFVTELIGAIFYLLAVGFYTLAKHPNMPIFFQAIFQLLTQILMVADAICLLSSVLVSRPQPFRFLLVFISCGVACVVIDY
jgi:hypothetical protein